MFSEMGAHAGMLGEHEPEATVVAPTGGRPPSTLDNSVVHAKLKPYWRLFEAVADYPRLDDFLVCACWLDLGGNTRPLRRADVFRLLRDLPCISTKAVQKAQRCSETHARKIARNLRVASKGLTSYFAIAPVWREDCDEWDASIYETVEDYVDDGRELPDYDFEMALPLTAPCSRLSSPCASC
jgi:hypothetical protein